MASDLPGSSVRGHTHSLRRTYQSWQRNAESALYSSLLKLESNSFHRLGLSLTLKCHGSIANPCRLAQEARLPNASSWFVNQG